MKGKFDEIQHTHRNAIHPSGSNCLPHKCSCKRWSPSKRWHRTFVKLQTLRNDTTWHQRLLRSTAFIWAPCRFCQGFGNMLQSSPWIRKSCASDSAKSHNMEQKSGPDSHFYQDSYHSTKVLFFQRLIDVACDKQQTSRKGNKVEITSAIHKVVQLVGAVVCQSKDSASYQNVLCVTPSQ